MKLRRPILSASLVLLTVFSLAFPASAIVGTQEILKRLLAAIMTVEKLNYQVLLTQTDSVRHDTPSTMTYTLTAGSFYKVIALGDNDRVADIDLKVYDENDNLVGSDDDDTNVAEVNVSPKWTGKFKFVVDAYKMNSGYNDAFYGLVVARKETTSKPRTSTQPKNSGSPAKFYN
ncbi:MAG: hypothetical protein LDL31_10690 [Prosthecobacter sp.]|nr:hypothetical protein [Prosthecobacter sp.]